MTDAPPIEVACPECGYACAERDPRNITRFVYIVCACPNQTREDAYSRTARSIHASTMEEHS